VEVDKAWETSYTRRILIIALTYVVILTFFLVLALPSPFISAIVPSLAFAISTMTVPIVKKWWMNKK